MPDDEGGAGRLTCLLAGNCYPPLAELQTAPVGPLPLTASPGDGLPCNPKPAFVGGFLAGLCAYYGCRPMESVFNNRLTYEKQHRNSARIR
jgi:hypothetical protein